MLELVDTCLSILTEVCCSLLCGIRIATLQCDDVFAQWIYFTITFLIMSLVNSLVK